MPERIQLSRRKGWRKPAGTVTVARPSQWGNPFKVGSSVRVGVYEFSDDLHRVDIRDRAHAVEIYRRWLAGRGDIQEQARVALAGRDLACWCPLVDSDGQPVPCHADVLLELANREES